MYELRVSLNDQVTTIKSPHKTIAALRGQLPHPIEIEAFGPQVVFSLMGQANSISLTLMDASNNHIDHESYEIKL